MSLKIHRERIAIAKELLIKGKPQNIIIMDFVAIGVSLNIARRYVKIAKQEIQNDRNNTTITELETHLAQFDFVLSEIYDELYSDNKEIDDEFDEFGNNPKKKDVKGLIALKLATIKEKSNLMLKIEELKNKVTTNDKPISFNFNVSGSQSTILSNLFNTNKE